MAYGGKRQGAGRPERLPAPVRRFLALQCEEWQSLLAWQKADERAQNLASERWQLGKSKDGASTTSRNLSADDSVDDRLALAASDEQDDREELWTRLVRGFRTQSERTLKTLDPNGVEALAIRRELARYPVIKDSDGGYNDSEADNHDVEDGDTVQLELDKKGQHYVSPSGAVRMISVPCKRPQGVRQGIVERVAANYNGMAMLSGESDTVTSEYVDWCWKEYRKKIQIKLSKLDKLIERRRLDRSQNSRKSDKT